ncbi:helix-turn-helix domain-containing protein [Actinomadura alba]|uniref:Helix-turn-helix domain-containing protein n=1 Tax=Actinomadura alba TaxID=406431 RepID=A0ABR7LY02_9ACTN|nr:helix-turn-helix transcriptional regulator [Actinomadura alba]MBC6469345.1 helix-turn-helix domain-containing protein [Actinomadura alba]
MYDEVTIGARLRTLRRWRGMTLAQLAGQSGLSTSFLSMAERGQRSLDRRSHIAALAAALKVSETELTGAPHLGHDPAQSDPHLRIPAIRAALQTSTLTEPSCERARPLPELVAELEQIEPAHQACDYLAVGEVLPDLMDELHLHVAEPQDERAHAVALKALVHACVIATFMSKDLGHNDLGHLAAVRADHAAAFLDDPVQKAISAFLRIHTAPRAGSWDRTLRMAERAASDLQPHTTDPRAIEVCGMLTLSASLSAAVLHKGDTSTHWMGQADELAARIPDTPEANWMSFSSTNVAVWKVAVAVENGAAGGSVLTLANKVNVDRLGDKRGRRASYMADVGRGLARDPKTRGEAVRWLREAEETAPQWIRNSAPVREAVAVMLEQAKVAVGGRELRGMAARMGVSH